MTAIEAGLRGRFHEVLSDKSEFRRVIGSPSYWFQSKILSGLDRRCRSFIASSPFVIIASSGSAGNLDISPRGDPAGFVQVLDQTTLAIPERPGNRRCDTLNNILENPNVGLIFFIPGKGETLRVAGKAAIVRDLKVRESMALGRRVPELAINVAVERAFLHCSNCIRRSRLWELGRDAADAPSITHRLEETGTSKEPSALLE